MSCSLIIHVFRLERIIIDNLLSIKSKIDYFLLFFDTIMFYVLFFNSFIWLLSVLL